MLFSPLGPLQCKHQDNWYVIPKIFKSIFLFKIVFFHPMGISYCLPDYWLILLYHSIFLLTPPYILFPVLHSSALYWVFFVFFISLMNFLTMFLHSSPEFKDILKVFFTFKFIYLVLPVLGLHCSVRASLYLWHLGATLQWCVCFSLQWLLLLQNRGSRTCSFNSCGSWGLDASACGIFQDQGLNPCLVCCQTNS